MKNELMALLADAAIGARALYVLIARRVAFKLLSTARRQERIVIRHHDAIEAAHEQQIIINRIRAIGGTNA